LGVGTLGGIQGRSGSEVAVEAGSHDVGEPPGRLPRPGSPKRVRRFLTTSSPLAATRFHESACLKSCGDIRS
jgi:hypothetical protein